jgi:N-acetyl-anhydromuramyl-L-alanine amidase AmpD
VANRITPIRNEVNGTFRSASLRIRTDAAPAWFEVALATDPALFSVAAKAQRTEANFYSTRGDGAIPAPGGDTIWIAPEQVLSRFIGQPRLYYALAVFATPDRADPAVVRAADAVAPFIAISRSFTGPRRRLSGVGVRAAAPSGNGYGAGDRAPAVLDWAGDAAVPGVAEPVAPPQPPAGASAPLSLADAFEYDDGLGPLESPAADDDRGIEGPIPDGGEEAVASALADAPAPEDPCSSRFAPAHAGNYRRSAGPRTISRIVVHITDGGARIGGTIAWFQNPDARVSAHYVIGQDGEIVQMVRHDDVAWHAGGANRDSIGIEHVANTRGLAPTTAQYAASARLVSWLCNRYGIPVDRTHVLGHAEADPRTTHTGCPNAVWDWEAYMNMVQNPPAQTQARALGSPVDLFWDDVEAVYQPTGVSCWAAAAAMVVGWRDRISINPEEFARHEGRWSEYKQTGLYTNDNDEFAAAWGLSVEPPQSYSVEGFRQVLAYSGPLWIGRLVGGSSGHAVCVYGISGDGSPDGTTIHFHDPWPPGQGTPSRSLSYSAFMAEYEGFITVDPNGRVNNQILHSGGTGGRSARTASAQALGNGRRARALSGGTVEVVSAIAGAIMTRVFDNRGDISWELDQLRGIKKPWDDAAHAGPTTFSTMTLTVPGPHASTFLGLDEIYTDVELRFQYNGRSVGNIQTSIVRTEDAAGLGLILRGEIMDEANAFRVPGSPDAFAAVNYRLHYTFDSDVYQNLIAVVDLVLYGNGTFTERFRWTQR